AAGPLAAPRRGDDARARAAVARAERRVARLEGVEEAVDGDEDAVAEGGDEPAACPARCLALERAERHAAARPARRPMPGQSSSPVAPPAAAICGPVRPPATRSVAPSSVATNPVPSG